MTGRARLWVAADTLAAAIRGPDPRSGDVLAILALWQQASALAPTHRLAAVEPSTDADGRAGFSLIYHPRKETP